MEVVDIRENIHKARVMAIEKIRLDPDYPYAEVEKSNQQALGLVPE